MNKVVNAFVGNNNDDREFINNKICKMTMEKQDKDDIESPRIDSKKAKGLLIKFGIIIITVGVLYGVGSMFISEPSPEVDEIITGKELAEIIIPPILEYTSENDPDIEYNPINEIQKDAGKSGLAELEFPVEESKVSTEPVYDNTFESNVDIKKDVINKVKEIPLTVLDMAKFVSMNPTLSDKKLTNQHPYHLM